MRRIGVVGLGSMGTALAESLLAEGYPVTCYDIRTEAVAAVAMHGASTAVSARQVAEESDLVFTVLPGPTEVLQVALDAENGILAGLAHGATLMDMSTCGPDVATQLHQKFTETGRVFVDTPVSGKAPRMTVLVGATGDDLGENDSVLRDVSSKVVYCGRLGSGYAVKLLNQHVKYAWYLATAEALLTAEEIGLDGAAVADALEECSASISGFAHAAEYYRSNKRAMKKHGPASTIEKDLNLAEEMVAEAGLTAPSLAAAAGFFREVGKTEFRQRPFPESSELLRELRVAPVGSEA